MTAGILAIAGIALGAALGRWWLAPVAGTLAAAATLALTPFSDSPFLFVGVVVTLATTVGVAASRAHRSVSNQER